MQSLGRPTLCYRASALEILPIAFIVTISEHKPWHPRFYLSCSSVTPALTPPKVISPLYWSKPWKTLTALVAAASADQGPSNCTIERKGLGFGAVYGHTPRLLLLL